MGLTQWGPQYHNTRRVEKLLQAFGGWEGEVGEVGEGRTIRKGTKQGTVHSCYAVSSQARDPVR